MNAESGALLSNSDRRCWVVNFIPGLRVQTASEEITDTAYVNGRRDLELMNSGSSISGLFMECVQDGLHRGFFELYHGLSEVRH